MNIKILDSWLREYLDTKAKPHEIGEKLSLTSVSVERIEKFGTDFVYDIEVTTNRPDLMSVIGLAREAVAMLPQFGIEATFKNPIVAKPKKITSSVKIDIQNDERLVHRICAVVMDVAIKDSPQMIKNRLESSDIRNLNNVIDITNYVMRVIGHPAHVFDFDRLQTDTLTIAEARKGEVIETLDGKTHTLQGGDIVARDHTGRIVDLLGIMGLKNSVVTDKTKRILFFIDNNDPSHMRKTSMSLAIRSEAAQLNEKGVDPESAIDALYFGIELYEKYADGKIISDIIDIYPNKPKSKTINVTKAQIEKVIGVSIDLNKAVKMLKDLGFSVENVRETLNVIVPSWRKRDVAITEDVIEEIARSFGYHNVPSVLPPIISEATYAISKDQFYWENRVKQTLKYWGFTEVYTYSMVSKNQYEGDLSDAVTIKNPLDEEHVYMRKTLIPSLLQAISENKSRETILIFEIANTYTINGKYLPEEKRMLAGIVKKPQSNFLEVKGIIEQLTHDLGIDAMYKSASACVGADIFVGKEKIGTIEDLDDKIIDFEIDFEAFIKYATLKKTFTPLAKYPPVMEDIALITPEDVTTGDIISLLKKQSPLIKSVTLLDKYNDTRTFHFVYQDEQKNLTNEDVAMVREKILDSLNRELAITLKK
jgi:phenylalanyl-tRNA synthetase beta chain